MRVLAWPGRRARHWIVAVVVAAVLSAGSYPVGASGSPATAPSPPSSAVDGRQVAFRPGEVLVKLRGENGARKLRLEPSAPVVAIANRYRQRPEVEYAEPNYVYRLSAFEPNDVYYPQQWYLRQVAAPIAWERTTGSPDVVVAVLDSGVDINHPDLAANIWTNAGEVPDDGLDNDGNGYVDDTRGWDFVDGTNDPRPDATPPYSRTALHHGTAIAGIIAAVGNNVQGIAGLAWQTRVMPLRVLDRQGEGDVEAVARAVEYATRNGANVINLSFVGTGFSQRLEGALERAYAGGLTIVVAAGNDSANGGTNLDTSPRYPICYDAKSNVNWIIGVTATDSLNQRALFANYGRTCVDVAAPGYEMFSAQVYDAARNLTELYGGPWSGTSLATPVVSAVAALVKAVNPRATNVEVTRTVLASAESPFAVNYRTPGAVRYGLVNAARAVGAATGAGSPPSPEVIADGARVVAVPAAAAIPELRVYTTRGEQRGRWSSFGETLRTGASVAVAENARLSPSDDGKLRLSGLIRGEQSIVVGEGIGGRGRVRTFGVTGQVESQWYAFDRPFRGGVAVAAGDLTGNGVTAVVVTPMSGGGPQVRIFDRGGRLQGQFFAYDRSLRGGYSVAVADTDGDGRSEIIVSRTTGRAAVRVFRSDGRLLREWYVYPASFAGGVNIAAGDVDGTGRASVVTTPASSGAPHAKVFSGTGKLLGEFAVFPGMLPGGVSVAVGDTDGDGRDEIAVAPASRGGPQVRLFTARGKILGQFFVYDRSFRAGVRLAILR